MDFGQLFGSLNLNIAGDREQKLRNSRSDFRDPEMVSRRHELGPYRDFKVGLRGLKKKKYNRALYTKSDSAERLRQPRRI